MREIKFRGLATGNDGSHKWFEGYVYVEAPPLQGIVPKDYQEPIGKHFIIFPGFADWNLPRPMQRVEVDPETIGQYTGLKDKNDKEIYESDLVKQVVRACDEEHSYPCDPDIYKVIFEEGGFWLVRPYQGTRLMRDFANLNEFIGLDRFEVIGNEFEHPELLK